MAMIEDAERRGRARSRAATLVEPTSGNTGIALAFVAAAGLPADADDARAHVAGAGRRPAHAGRARSCSRPGSLMRGAVEKAEEIVRADARRVMLQQFKNPANPEVHRRTTAEEIWDDTDGEVDIFVAGVGTGGTITGVGEVLKARKPGVRVVAVEPASAAVLSGGAGRRAPPDPGHRRRLRPRRPEPRGHRRGGRRHRGRGVRRPARRSRAEKGISAGISSGAALAAALRWPRRRRSRASSSWSCCPTAASATPPAPSSRTLCASWIETPVMDRA